MMAKVVYGIFEANTDFFVLQADLQTAARSSEKVGKKEKEKELFVVKKKCGDEAVQVNCFHCSCDKYNDQTYPDRLSLVNRIIRIHFMGFQLRLKNLSRRDHFCNLSILYD